MKKNNKNDNVQQLEQKWNGKELLLQNDIRKSLKKT